MDRLYPWLRVPALSRSDRNNCCALRRYIPLAGLMMLITHASTWCSCLFGVHQGGATIVMQFIDSDASRLTHCRYSVFQLFYSWIKLLDTPCTDTVNLSSHASFVSPSILNTPAILGLGLYRSRWYDPQSRGAAAHHSAMLLTPT
jgi:hypothetical protein